MAVAARTTAKPDFVRRSRCPVCGTGVPSQTLYTARYDEPPVADYLSAFYAAQGPGVEWEYLKGAVYQLDACVGCGLIFQRDVPNQALARKLYEEWIDPDLALRRYRADRNAAKRCAREALELYLLLALLGRPPSEVDVLDFGMGWGGWCELAQAFGCNVCGTELSEARIRYAAGRGVRVLPLDQLETGRYDLIQAEQVLEHLPEPFEDLRRLASLLKNGGLFRISVPNGFDARRVIAKMDWEAPKGARDSLNIVAPLEHLNCFSRRSLVLMARRAGLDLCHLPTGLGLREAGIVRVWGILGAIRRPVHRFDRLHRLLQALTGRTLGLSLLFRKPG